MSTHQSGQPSGYAPARVSPLAGSVPAVSRQGRRPDEVHILSSTATSAAVELRKNLGNTGHRKRGRHDTSGIAEGVTLSAEKMVKALGDINDTTKATEREKLQVQTKLFEQNLDYKKERDRLQLENARIAQEHTRLSLMNQQMVVQAIANLASAISRSVAPARNASARATNDANGHPAPTEDPPDEPAHM